MIAIVKNSRKIIHVDMDCFYAAIEMRDNPELMNKPVAVGGSPYRRGVICTCNYVARDYGIRAAMPSAIAYRHCKDLVLLPVNMAKYQQVAKKIQSIFREYTDLVEPLSLDEAYLDVSNSAFHRGSATWIAKAIRNKIWQRENLTASAGVAPNKFLAKIASGWRKPNGLYVITPSEVASFIKDLPVEELFGVGKVTAEKLHRQGLKTCTDLQKFSLGELMAQFGKFGQQLYEQSRGIDNRVVNPHRTRKSLSVEQTFIHDINNIETSIDNINELYHKLLKRMQSSGTQQPIKNQYIKIKFSDFKVITSEIACNEINLPGYLQLFRDAYAKEQKTFRLLGLGVHFNLQEKEDRFLQQSLF